MKSKSVNNDLKSDSWKIVVSRQYNLAQNANKWEWFEIDSCKVVNRNVKRRWLCRAIYEEFLHVYLHMHQWKCVYVCTENDYVPIEWLVVLTRLCWMVTVTVTHGHGHGHGHCHDHGHGHGHARSRSRSRSLSWSRSRSQSRSQIIQPFRITVTHNPTFQNHGHT